MGITMPEVAQKEALKLLEDFGYKSRSGKLTRHGVTRLREILKEKTKLSDVVQESDIEIMKQLPEDDVASLTNENLQFIKNITLSNSSALNRTICRYSLEFLEEFKDCIDWDNPSVYSAFRNPNCSKYEVSMFLSRFAHEINWDLMVMNYRVTEEFAGIFYEHINWDFGSQWIKLSENFMRQFADDLNWKALCQYQKMGEDFIFDMKEYIDWDSLVRHQTLSVKISLKPMKRTTKDIVTFMFPV
jgi:hypothetical protein